MVDLFNSKKMEQINPLYLVDQTLSIYKLKQQFQYISIQMVRMKDFAFNQQENLHSHMMQHQQMHNMVKQKYQNLVHLMLIQIGVILVSIELEQQHGNKVLILMILLLQKQVVLPKIHQMLKNFVLQQLEIQDRLLHLVLGHQLKQMTFLHTKQDQVLLSLEELVAMRIEVDYQQIFIVLLMNGNILLMDMLVEYILKMVLQSLIMVVLVLVVLVLQRVFLNYFASQQQVKQEYQEVIVMIHYMLEVEQKVMHLYVQKVVLVLMIILVLKQNIILHLHVMVMEINLVEL